MIPGKDELDSWSCFSDLQFSSVTNQSIDLLIGIDNRRATMPLEYRYGPDYGSDAVRTPYGWTICGLSMKGMGCDLQNADVVSVNINWTEFCIIQTCNPQLSLT